MKLTSQRENQISKFVENEELKVDSLRDDIIDHLCGEVVTLLKTGIPFEQALNDAVKELAPKGLKEIDRETLDLLNGRFIRMKKVTYMIGFLGSILFILGLAYMGYDPSIAIIVFVSGMLFLVVFLPLYAVDRYLAGERSKVEIIKLILGSLTGVIYGTGLSLKLMGFSSGGLIGMSLIPLLLFIPFLFLSMYKKSIAS